MPKIQDILFLALYIFLLFKKQPRLLVLGGLVCLLLSIPLFFFWIFFTAQRLIWYGSALIFTGALFFALTKDEGEKI